MRRIGLVVGSPVALYNLNAGNDFDGRVGSAPYLSVPHKRCLPDPIGKPRSQQPNQLSCQLEHQSKSSPEPVKTSQRVHLSFHKAWCIPRDFTLGPQQLFHSCQRAPSHLQQLYVGHLEA